MLYEQKYLQTKRGRGWNDRKIRPLHFGLSFCFSFSEYFLLPNSSQWNTTLFYWFFPCLPHGQFGEHVHILINSTLNTELLIISTAYGIKPIWCVIKPLSIFGSTDCRRRCKIKDLPSFQFQSNFPFQREWNEREKWISLNQTCDLVKKGLG